MKRKFFLVLFSLLVLFSSICSVNAFDETTREDFAINSRYTGVYSYFAGISAGAGVFRNVIATGASSVFSMEDVIRISESIF